MEKPHKKLDAWKKAMDLATDIYRIAEAFPAGGRFGLVSQMRRCAVSVPSNLAEGLARRGDMESLQFVHVAMGSISELDAQVDLSGRLGLIAGTGREQLESRLTEVDKLLVGLRNHLRRKASIKDTER